MQKKNVNYSPVSSQQAGFVENEHQIEALTKSLKWLKYPVPAEIRRLCDQRKRSNSLSLFASFISQRKSKMTVILAVEQKSSQNIQLLLHWIPVFFFYIAIANM